MSLVENVKLVKVDEAYNGSCELWEMFVNEPLDVRSVVEDYIEEFSFHSDDSIDDIVKKINEFIIDIKKAGYKSFWFGIDDIKINAEKEIKKETQEIPVKEKVKEVEIFGNKLSLLVENDTCFILWNNEIVSHTESFTNIIDEIRAVIANKIYIGVSNNKVFIKETEMFSFTKSYCGQFMYLKKDGYLIKIISANDFKNGASKFVAEILISTNQSQIVDLINSVSGNFFE